MSNEIKVGDKVRVSSKLPKIYERFGARICLHGCATITLCGINIMASVCARSVGRLSAISTHSHSVSRFIARFTT